MFFRETDYSLFVIRIIFVDEHFSSVQFFNISVQEFLFNAWTTIRRLSRMEYELAVGTTSLHEYSIQIRKEDRFIATYVIIKMLSSTIYYVIIRHTARISFLRG